MSAQTNPCKVMNGLKSQALESVMHPLNEAQPYPFENWWVAAYAGEVGRTILARTILAKRIVLFRTEAGEAVALDGYCPHRSFPLEESKLVGDAVQCAYHGFMFGRDGKCSHIPSQASVPSKIATRHYPVVERGGLVWIWTGDVDNADPMLIPDTSDMGLNIPGWTAVRYPMVTIAARYTSMIDNLLDLSHISFIHATSLANAGGVAELPIELIETTTSLNARRIARSVPASPYVRFLFPDREGAVDQCLDALYLGPEAIQTGGWFRDPESGDELGSILYLHFITPETETTHHYFPITTRNFALDSKEVCTMIEGLGGTVLPEDRHALEAIESGFRTANRSPTEVSCRADTGALKVRHRLAQQIRSEVAAKTKKTKGDLVIAA